MLRGIPASLYRRLDGVLCQIKHIAEEAKVIGVNERLCFPIRNGLPVRQWRDGAPSRKIARAKLGVDLVVFAVVGLGRFTHRKRFGDLIGAFDDFTSSLPCSVPRPVLLLHGSDFGQDDGEEPQLRRNADAFSADIRFVSPSLDPRITLSAADVMVTLSEREGAPNVSIEAFASDCPVIATDLVGHRVYVCDGRQGLLVSVGDRKAVVDALHTMIDYPVWRQRMAAAAAESANQFDIVSTAQDYLRAFSVARQRKGAVL